MIVLIGEFMVGEGRVNRYMAERLRRHGWGRMWVTKGPYFEYDGEPFGVDNGAFGAWNSGKPWDESAFLRRVDSTVAKGRDPYLSVAPDIVAGGLKSLDFSVSWRPRLPEQMRWYLAVQDGMTPDDVAPVIDMFSGVFLGGTDAFKKTVRTWRAWTRERGLPLHWARCGTARKLREAIDVGVDSVDSATPLLQLAAGREHVFRRFELAYLGSNQGELAFAD